MERSYERDSLIDFGGLQDARGADQRVCRNFDYTAYVWEKQTRGGTIALFSDHVRVVSSWPASRSTAQSPRRKV